jgi:hypothetical protein
MTYLTLIKTRHLGKNVKILGSLLLPLPLVLFPLTVICFSLVGGVFYAIIKSFVYTYENKNENDNNFLFKGFYEVWKGSVDVVKTF